VRGQRAARGEIDLERANQTLAVSGHDPVRRVGINAAQQPMQAFRSPARRNAIQARAKRLVGAGSGKQPSRQRAVIEAGAADQERHVPACVHVANDAIGVARVLRRCVHVSRIGDVDQVMRNAALFGGRHFVGADVEPPIHGRGITVENLAANPLRQRQSQRALPGRRRSEHRQNDRLRAQSTRMNT
jgi:hypothetical protein